MVTLFHKPSSTASTRVLTILKQTNAQAVAHATEDQASSHHAQNKVERMEFELDVTEAPPTTDQLKSILDYLGGAGAASKVIKGAQDEADAMRRLKADGETFERPVVSAACARVLPIANPHNRWWTGTKAKQVYIIIGRIPNSHFADPRSRRRKRVGDFIDASLHPQGDR